MPRLLIFVLALLGAAGIVLLLSTTGMLSSPPKIFMVVAARNIPSDQVFRPEDLALRQLQKDQQPPPGAFLVPGPLPAVDKDGHRPASPIVTWLTHTRTSARNIVTGDPITGDTALSEEAAVAREGVPVLIAMRAIAAGERLDLENVKAEIKPRAEAGRAPLIGFPQEGTPEFLMRLGAATAAADLDAGVVLSLDTVVVPRTGETKPASSQPLSPQDDVDTLPRSEVSSRLDHTPGAVVLSSKDAMAAVAGRDAFVDVFLSGLPKVAKAEGVEMHTRVIANAELRLFDDRNSNPIAFVFGTPNAAREIESARRQGALVTVVPAGFELPAESGGTVYCRRHVCFRTYVEPESPRDASGVSPADGQSPAGIGGSSGAGKSTTGRSLSPAGRPSPQKK